MLASWSSTLRQRALLGALAGLFIIAGALAARALRTRKEGAAPLATEVAPVAAPPAVTDTPPATSPTQPSTSPTATEAPSPTPPATPTALPPTEPAPTEAPTATPFPLPTPDGASRRLRVPILMYHYLSAPPPGADSIRRELSVAPEQFAEHLHYLREAGYETITLHDLSLALQIGHPLPERPIIITFDDGYRDNYEHAFPLLKAYGFTATFFLITGHLDEGHEAYMTWDQVIEMHAAGMDMEAHGHTHVVLSGRDVDYLVWQMLGAKEAIEARTGEPVRFFCYPSGKYDDLAIRVLHSAHYWGAVTVHLGVEHSSDAMFTLARLRVPGGCSAARLAAMLDAHMNAP
ncbi:MAG TPA: polysaccharide deacetylase family protein [Chloroflexi bacterium]|jgi:peptidoglycan/xylan/chitin deacetylase (PgdA/CDA1 family)|nr:polysaccharide deacetylase family protein [Chloroflexota bacterium]